MIGRPGGRAPSPTPRPLAAPIFGGSGSDGPTASRRRERSTAALGGGVAFTRLRGGLTARPPSPTPAASPTGSAAALRGARTCSRSARWCRDASPPSVARGRAHPARRAELSYQRFTPGHTFACSAIAATSFPLGASAPCRTFPHVHCSRIFTVPPTPATPCRSRRAAVDSYRARGDPRPKSRVWRLKALPRAPFGALFSSRASLVAPVLLFVQVAHQFKVAGGASRRPSEVPPFPPVLAAGAHVAVVVPAREHAPVVVRAHVSTLAPPPTAWCRSRV
jgi:hypothetical protein